MENLDTEVGGGLENLTFDINNETNLKTNLDGNCGGSNSGIYNP